MHISQTRFLQYATPITKKGLKAQQTAEAPEAKKGSKARPTAEPTGNPSGHVQRKIEERKKGTPLFDRRSYHATKISSDAKIDGLLESQFGAGRLYAAIASRPGQSGRADGYILEGKELEVYLITPPALLSSQKNLPVLS